MDSDNEVWRIKQFLFYFSSFSSPSTFDYSRFHLPPTDYPSDSIPIQAPKSPLFLNFSVYPIVNSNLLAFGYEIWERIQNPFGTDAPGVERQISVLQAAQKAPQTLP